MLGIQANRMIDTGSTWVDVVIVKGVPGHPEGAKRRVRREQAERWAQFGVCRPDYSTGETPVKKKRGRPRKSA